MTCFGDLASTFEWYLEDVTEVGTLIVSWAANVAYVSTYALILPAVVMMVRWHATTRLRPVFLDVATLVTAVSVGAWEVLISPQLHDGPLSPNVVLRAFYPLLDMSLVACVLLLVLSPGVQGPAARILISAEILILVTDVCYSVLPRWLSDDQVVRLGGLMLFANVLLVVAVLYPEDLGGARSAPAQQDSALHPARLLLLGAALVVAPLVGLTESRPATSERLILAAATVIGTGFVLARISGAVRAHHRAQRQLVYQAAHDPLTGLVNRRTLDERLTALLSQDRGDLALLYIDLDGFKAVNDTAGHEAGDAVLVEVASRLSAALDETGLVARLGGDEFVVVCPDMPLDRAGELADRLLVALRIPVCHEGVHHRIGASIGIVSGAAVATEAAMAPEQVSPQQLLHMADKAMYRAKRLGRGRWSGTGNATDPVAIAAATRADADVVHVRA